MKSWPKTIGLYACLLSMSLLAGVACWWTIRHGTPSVDAEIRIKTNVRTSHIKLAEPFSLSIRERHIGFEEAPRVLKTRSIHPAIVKNDTGLLIGIPTDRRTVNGRPVEENLFVDFGDIAPITARWIISCALSGRFVDFEAEFTRADKLGGRMPSFLATEKINVPIQIADVMMDAKGRDSIVTLLVKKGELYRVYESDLTQSVVANPLSDSTTGNTGKAMQVNTSPTTSFTYVRLDYPFNGTMLIESAIRPDGRRINAANVCYSTYRPVP